MEKTNLSGKGERRRATLYTFRTAEGLQTYSSNACRWEDARKAAGLDDSVTLDSATSFAIYDGVKDDAVHVDFIWAYRGALPSGKASIKVLLEVGAITQEQADIILNEKEVRL